MTRILLTLTITILIQLGAYSQAPTATCATAQPFCTGTTVNFPGGVNNGNAFTGPYNCLGTSPNPAWYYLEIANPGNLDITMQSTPLLDIDFILWGPFPSIASMCSSYSLTNVVDCSYSPASTEIANIVGATTGQVYLLLITNYSNAACNISFNQTGGLATTNCNILCNMTSLTAIPSACDPATNTYSVSGLVNFQYPPTTGTLTISSNCGGNPIIVNSSQTLASPYAYTINNIPAVGGACSITATFSADPTCNKTTNYAGPICGCGLTATSTTVPVSCIGLNDGSATVSPSGFWAPPTYSWSPTPGSNNSINGLFAGTYTCYITDTLIANCSTAVTVNVGTAPDMIFPTIQGCPTNISLNTDNGVCGAIATWVAPIATDNCSATISQTSGQASGSVFPLGVSTVTYTAQDLAGNTSTCSFTITVTDNENPVIVNCPANQVLGNDAGLCGAVASWQTPSVTDNCSATITQIQGAISGSLFPLGVSTITYLAADPSGNKDTCTFTITINDTEKPVISNCPSNIVLNLAARCDTVVNWTVPTYTDNCAGVTMSASHQSGMTFGLGITTVTYIATDAVGLKDTCTFTITVNPPPAINAFLSQLQNPNCNGEKGLAAVSVSGGSGAYTYTWSSTPFQYNDSIQLNAGAYTITVKDAFAATCVSNVVLPFQIIEPPILTLNLTHTNPSCFGFSNGDANALVGGGTLPYTYLWNTVPAQGTPTITNLSKGNYTVVVTDAKGCSLNQSVSLTEPDSLRAGVTQLNVRCFGLPMGKASIYPSKGTPPYQYVWTNTASTGNIAPDLLAGIYTVTVTDAQACTINRTFVISEPIAPVVATFEKNDAICYGTKTGSINLAGISGGTPGYTYTWNTNPIQYTPNIGNVSTGNYTLTIHDANYCELRNVISIGQPPKLDIQIVDKSQPYCNLMNGSIQATATGGTSPYIFQWNDSATTINALVQHIGEGTYQSTVIDANGCRDSVSAVLKNTPPAQAAFTSTPTNAEPIVLTQANINFDNQSQGALSYSWSFGDGFTSSSENPVHQFNEPGTYTVNLTAYNGYDICPVNYALTYIILPDGTVFIPNSFSPNNDGINDLFEIKGEGIVSLQAEIYNRWGTQIYSLNSVSDTWNGKEKGGVDVPEGVYTYKINVSLYDGRRLIRSGTITLIR